MQPILALSAAAGLGELLAGHTRRGTHLGAGHVAVGDRVVSLTRPGAPRLPNGIECEARFERGEDVWIGSGAVHVESWWDAVPSPRVSLAVTPAGAPTVAALAGRGGGLTPSGDDLLCGYAAGLVLFAGRHAEAEAIAREAGSRTTLLSRTLLACAARGELASPAHAFLESGDPGPLRRFGNSSGRALLVGLALAGSAC